MSANQSAPDIRLQRSVIEAAIQTARSLRATADRMEDAARSGDFARLSELALPINFWTVDKIAGVAMAIVRAG